MLITYNLSEKKKRKEKENADICSMNVFICYTEKERARAFSTSLEEVLNNKSQVN